MPFRSAEVEHSRSFILFGCFDAELMALPAPEHRAKKSICLTSAGALCVDDSQARHKLQPSVATVDCVSDSDTSKRNFLDDKDTYFRQKSGLYFRHRDFILLPFGSVNDGRADKSRHSVNRR